MYMTFLNMAIGKRYDFYIFFIYEITTKKVLENSKSSNTFYLGSL